MAAIPRLVFPFVKLTLMPTYVGIDVAKDTLAVAVPSPNSGWKLRDYTNSPEGIYSLLNDLPSNTHCILEATGSYSVLVAYMLTQAQVTISVINPRQSHHFAKMQLSVTKTDPRDAVILAEYGRLIQPPVYQFSKECLLAIRQKRALLRQYLKQRVMLLNLSESFAPLPYKDESAGQSLRAMITHLMNRLPS